MNETRATIAIVRRHIDRRFARDFTMQFAIVAILAYVFTPLFGAFALAAIAALASTVALESTTARSLRRLSFFTVPLYGRQLARAHAIAPALLALSIPLGYVVGAALRGHGPDLEHATLAGLVTLVATLVALSAAFRDGPARALYGALACAAGLSIAGFGTLAEIWFKPAIGIAVIEGFFALRAFGETLARYDPLPDGPAIAQPTPGTS